MRNVPTLLARLAPIPDADFAELGAVEIKSLWRLLQLVGRNCVIIPYVTYGDEIDGTDAETRRSAWNTARPDAKVTSIALLARAMADPALFG